MSAKIKNPGLLGRKIGMTQFFTEAGEAVGVTVIEVGPCIITQVKQRTSDGYDALQLGFDEMEFRRTTRALRGHFEKKSLKPFRHLKEFRVQHPENFKVGQELRVGAFQVGEKVDITGVSKGKGFQGVIKRHHKAGGPASHGSRFHRSTGSIGQRTWPGRVFPLMKLPGHMGDRRVTARNLKIVQVLPEKNYLVVEGSVPGAENALVFIKSLSAGEFEKRLIPAAGESPGAGA
jgi:large subunit ribosomal protein L3